MPEEGETYWTPFFFSGEWGVDSRCWYSEDDDDIKCLKKGLVFKTKEEAEAALPDEPEFKK